jgi:RHH-type proline utilization regulon transcriptional repressor/proline dehydrogenase/delta 1-pyrroline-5-carboxylate dehydrogenase
VGAHRDLLAYLVRRLLENGANSSFVNQIVDDRIPPEQITRDPVSEVEALGDAIANPAIRPPRELFGDERPNSKGFRINEPASITPLLEAREAFADSVWTAAPMLASGAEPIGPGRDVTSPAEPNRVVGRVFDAVAEEVSSALDAAQGGYEEWSARSARERADVLRKVADLYEANVAELCAIATREAGKMLLDGIAEVREAVDFLR